MLLDDSRPFIAPASHETRVEDVDLSDSKGVDPEVFTAFNRLSVHNKFGNNRFKFKLHPQCRYCRKRHFDGADQCELIGPEFLPDWQNKIT